MARIMGALVAAWAVLAIIVTGAVTLPLAVFLTSTEMTHAQDR